MKFSSITIVYNRARYETISLTYPVYLRIHFRGKTDYIRIHDVPNVHKKDWIGDARRGRYVNDFFFNQIICKTLEETRSWANEQIGKGVPLTTRMIKDHLNGGIATGETFNQWCYNFEHHRAQLRRGVYTV